MGRNAKLKEKQKWSNGKLHLENARILRGIHFIDPEDKEFKETIKNARKKLETPIALAMPCKIMKKNCGSDGSNKIKTRLACILEADESTRLRMGELVPNHREDHIAGKGHSSCEGGVDVVGVVTPLCGVAQVVLRGVQVVEVGVRLRVHQDRGVEEDGEGQVEVEREEGEVKERRSCMKMG